MSYPTPHSSASPDDLQLPLDKRHIDAATDLFQENKEVMETFFLRIGLQMSRDNVELRDNLVQVFVELGVPIKTISDTFNISRHEVGEIVASDPVSLFDCLECGAPLEVRSLGHALHLKRALDTARKAVSGSQGSAHLFCGACTEAVLERLNEQGRRDRLGLEARIWELNNRMSYEEYLKTSEWRAKKINALGWAKHRSQLCNSADEELHVHHRVYTRRGCERLEDLIVLCGKHHRLFHRDVHDAS
jgi:hypothetical protein